MSFSVVSFDENPIKLLSYSMNAVTKKKYFFYLVIPYLILFTILEVTVRSIFWMNHFIAPYRHTSPELGWETTENVQVNRNIKGYGKINYSTYENGFRIFGDPNSAGVKIFVIGDSITQGTVVSDGGTYYDYLARTTVMWNYSLMGAADMVLYKSI